MFHKPAYSICIAYSVEVIGLVARISRGRLVSVSEVPPGGPPSTDPVLIDAALQVARTLGAEPIGLPHVTAALVGAGAWACHAVINSLARSAIH